MAYLYESLGRVGIGEDTQERFVVYDPAVRRPSGAFEKKVYGEAAGFDKLAIILVDQAGKKEIEFRPDRAYTPEEAAVVARLAEQVQCGIV